MKHADQQQLQKSRRWRSAQIATLCVLASALMSALAPAALGSSSLMLTTSSTRLGKVVVAQGRTMYALSPETTHHLLCTSNECFKFWPPLTVSSQKVALKAGAGVHGHLAILRRSNGMLQVTLNGMPLYHYSGDHKSGDVNGQHIHSFGGIWHVVK